MLRAIYNGLRAIHICTTSRGSWNPTTFILIGGSNLFPYMDVDLICGESDLRVELPLLVDHHSRQILDGHSQPYSYTRMQKDADGFYTAVEAGMPIRVWHLVRFPAAQQISSNSTCSTNEGEGSSR